MGPVQFYFDFKGLLFSFEETTNDASEEGLQIETVPEAFELASVLLYFYFYSRGFYDFSLCPFFLRVSSNLPQECNITVETKVSL